MISFLLTESWVALALCSCSTTALQERIPIHSSPKKQSELTESGEWTRYYIVNQLVWHLTGITGSLTGFVKFKPRSQAVQN